MASESQEKPEGDGKKIQNKCGQAVLGCFLRNEQNQGNTLAMVCRHVTKSAQGQFYFDREFKIVLAHKIDNSNCCLDDLKIDVDLVRFEESSEHLIQSVYRDVCCRKRKIRLFEGTVTDLKDAQVFQCCRSKNKKKGHVLQMSSVPERLANVIDSDRNFIVDDINGEPFANEGDSGRVVGREKDGGIELVGIITWGQYQCHDSPGKSGCLSICMLLRYAIEHLNKKYNYHLSLLESVSNKSVVNDHDNSGDNDDGGANRDDDNGNAGDDYANVDDGSSGTDDDVDDNTVEPGQIVFFPLLH